MKSLKTVIAVDRAHSPAAKTATSNGNVIDLLGFEAATVEVTVGTVTDGTTTFKIQESQDNVTFTDVAANCVLGSFPSLTSGAGNGSSSVTLVDYIGACRYIQIVMTIAGATTGVVLAVNVIKGAPRHAPAGITQVP